MNDHIFEYAHFYSVTSEIRSRWTFIQFPIMLSKLGYQILGYSRYIPLADNDNEKLWADEI